MVDKLNLTAKWKYYKLKTLGPCGPRSEDGALRPTAGRQICQKEKGHDDESNRSAVRAQRGVRRGVLRRGGLHDLVLTMQQGPLERD